MLFHALIVGAIFGYAYYLRHQGNSWGNNAATTSAIQATMVNAIPLPPRQPVNADNVLTSETPSPAPPTAKEKLAPPPEPTAIPIPEKPKPVKVAPKPVQATPHPQPVPPQPQKATTGEATGVRIAMTSTQTRAGTVSIGATDAAFGARFAYYVAQIKQKVAAQWYTAMLDPAAKGHRVYIVFQISRDGTPSSIRIQQPSGDPTLDQTALSAVQHIDTFGPLPDGYNGNYITVVYYFDPPSGP
ncbi:MAG TPA: TonB family protein [Granulicella sp.]|nr:TonB family protein [Granulicella sp.]